MMSYLPVYIGVGANLLLASYVGTDIIRHIKRSRKQARLYRLLREFLVKHKKAKFARFRLGFFLVMDKDECLDPTLADIIALDCVEHVDAIHYKVVKNAF